MKPATRRFISMLFALALLVGSGVVYFDFILPVYGTVQEARSEQASRQAALEAQQGAVKAIKDTLKKYNQQKDLQQSVSDALPLSPSVADLLAQVYFIAKTDGVRADSFGVSTPGITVATTDNSGAGAKTSSSVVSPVGTVELQLRLNGSYENFKKFLTDIETNIRIVDIKEANIAASGRPGDNVFSFDLKIVAYYQVASRAASL